MHRFKLKHVLIVSCSAIVLFSTILVSIFSYQQFKHTIKEQFASSRVDVLRQVSERVSGTNDCITVLSNFYFNNLPVEMLSADTEEFQKKHQDALVDQLLYLDEISAKTIEGTGISCHYVLSLNNGFSYCSTGNHENFSLSEYQKKLWYSDIVNADGQAVWISTYKNFDFRGKDEQYVYSLARSIKDPTTGESIGIFLFNIQETSISSCYDTIVGNNAIYVVDSGGRIVSHKNKDMLGIGFFHMERLRKLLDGNEFCDIKKNSVPYLLSVCENESYQWLLIEEIPLADILAPLKTTQRNIITLDILVLLITFAIVGFFSIRTTRPLHQLCTQLMRVGQTPSEEGFAVHGWHEINEINDECNNMLSRIQALIQDVKTKENTKRKLELSLLQAQINPHFVYNTLFSIKCLIDMENKDKALGIVDRFTDILKSVLSVSEPFTSIAEEITMLTKYCELQKYRYGDIFQCVITCEPGLENCKILRMLIQPLVENAIFHGISCCNHPGRIDISIAQKEENLQVLIKDNGVGMTSEELDAITLGKSKVGKQRSNFIGIRNITDRIDLYFGSAYGIKIESQPNQGTHILLTLPILYE